MGVLEIVRFGPLGKIQTTLSESPNGWHDPHEPQPLFDIRPMTVAPAGVADEFADGRVIQLLSDVNPVFGCARGRQARRTQVAVALSGEPMRSMR